MAGPICGFAAARLNLHRDTRVRGPLDLRAICVKGFTRASEDLSARRLSPWGPRVRTPATAGHRATAKRCGLSVLLDLPDDWRANVEGAPRPLSAHVGTHVDRSSWLGRLRVRLDGADRLAFDYLDGPPPLLPPTFAFRFVPGEERARFVVTWVGVGERVASAW